MTPPLSSVATPNPFRSLRLCVDVFGVQDQICRLLLLIPFVRQTLLIRSVQWLDSRARRHPWPRPYGSRCRSFGLRYSHKPPSVVSSAWGPAWAWWLWRWLRSGVCQMNPKPGSGETEQTELDFQSIKYHWRHAHSSRYSYYIFLQAFATSVFAKSLPGSSATKCRIYDLRNYQYKWCCWNRFNQGKCPEQWSSHYYTNLHRASIPFDLEP